MAVVMLDARPCSWSQPFADCVGIIEAKHACTAFIVQRQRVGQAVRAFRGNRYQFHHELDPMLSSFVGEERFSIEEQESIKARIAVCHSNKLSSDDNFVKRKNNDV